jgi:hypothetical protein
MELIGQNQHWISCFGAAWVAVLLGSDRMRG